MVKNMRSIKDLGVYEQTTYPEGKVIRIVGVSDVEALIKERETARNEKNWARADDIRGELKAMNIEIEDGADGTRWHRVY